MYEEYKFDEDQIRSLLSECDRVITHLVEDTDRVEKALAYEYENDYDTFNSNDPYYEYYIRENIKGIDQRIQQLEHIQNFLYSLPILNMLDQLAFDVQRLKNQRKTRKENM